MAVVRAALDEHVRVAQVEMDNNIAPFTESEAADGAQLFSWHTGKHILAGLLLAQSAVCRQLPLLPKSHQRRCGTDWPHDLTAYNPNPQEPWRNAGSIRQPFPDATLALSTIFFLSDVGPDRGGTWVVPRSFRDPRNPRGVHDGIDSFSAIPGQLQVTAKAGDVFVQDTR